MKPFKIAAKPTQIKYGISRILADKEIRLNVSIVASIANHRIIISMKADKIK